MTLAAELEPLVEAQPVQVTLSRAESAYVQAIYEMAEDDLTVAQARLAERLGVSRPAVSQMMQRLGRQGAVEIRGRTVRLSAHGRAHAESAVRRHRLIERLLTDRLGIGAAAAHAEAERLEHAVSPSVDDALDRYLGHPTTCPHGNPIPGSGYRTPEAVPLLSAPPGHIVYVERIPERLEVTPGVLELLERSGLLRGARAGLLAADDESALIRNGRGDEVAVPRAIAMHLLVRIGGPDR
jgi:DtxR family Mn-dependent transcriptional regulator